MRKFQLDSPCKALPWILATVAAACLMASVGAMAQSSHGLLPGNNNPAPLAYRQSLFAGYAEDRVGTAVSISGDLLAVGVPGADSGNNFDIGRVDIYRWFDEAPGWFLITSYTTQSFGIAVLANARFGASVSLSRGWLLVGCPGCNPADNAKAILLRIPDTIEAPNAPEGGLEWYRANPPGLENFSDPQLGTGAAVALSVVSSGAINNPATSIVFAVGSPAATYGNFTLGAIAMGRLQNQQVVWEFGPTYGSADFAKYGANLSLSAATWIDLGLYFNQRDLIVGEPGWFDVGGSGTPGKASLWKRSGTNWTLFQDFEAPSAGFLDALGSAVAVERADNESLGTIALGAPGRSVNGNPGGSVLVYRQTAIDGAYQFDQELQHPNSAQADRFGGALALKDSRLMVGADGRAVDVSANAGTVYVYRYEFSLVSFQFDWLLKQSLIEPREPGGNSAFGSSVAIDRRAAAIGAPLSDAAGLPNAGRVATYLCDRIFSDGIEGNPSNACGGP